jgi:hypothetical protein
MRDFGIETVIGAQNHVLFRSLFSNVMETNNYAHNNSWKCVNTGVIVGKGVSVGIFLAIGTAVLSFMGFSSVRSMTKQ